MYPYFRNTKSGSNDNNSKHKYLHNDPLDHSNALIKIEEIYNSILYICFKRNLF